MKKLPFKLGADPEFCIVLQEKLVPANQLLTTLFGPEHDDRMGFNVGTHGILGWDGASATGEIRPSPSNDPSKLTENIRKLFEHLTKKTELFSLSTLSDKAPIGGHIHFELPPDKQGQVTVSNIHKKMMSFYIPVMLGENNMNLRMRNRQNYGKITDHRSEQHDGAVTYEFRVPSAEWITTPKVAEATLAYLACVYNEILHHPKNFLKNRNLITKNEAQAKALQELTLANFEALTSVICGKIKKALKTFEYYEHYKEQIDFILNPKRVLKEKERVDYNIVQGWELGQAGNPTKRQLLSEKQLRERASKVDLDSLSCLISIQYNQDEYVDLFVRAIKHRIIAMNWKLQNNYFLFGLKRGVKAPIVRNKMGEYLTGHEQIKTKLDWQVIDETFNRMDSRFRTTDLRQAEDHNKRQIIIGLPYDLRIAQDTKTIIELVHSIEKGRYKPAKMTGRNLINDEGKAADETGKIFQVYNRQAAERIEAQDVDDTLAREIADEARRDAMDAEAETESDDQEMPFKRQDNKIDFKKENKLYREWCIKHDIIPTPEGWERWIDDRSNLDLCAEL